MKVNKVIYLRKIRSYLRNTFYFSLKPRKRILDCKLSAQKVSIYLNFYMDLNFGANFTKLYHAVIKPLVNHQMAFTDLVC